MVCLGCMPWKFDHIHIVTYFCHRYYAKEVKRIFYTELKEEQERVLKQAFIGNIIHIKNKDSETDESQEKQIEQSEEVLLENSNSKKNSIKAKDGKLAIMNKFLNAPARDWTERENYGKSLLQTQDPLKEGSIMNIHSKRLNVLEEYRTLELFSLINTNNSKFGAKIGEKDSDKSNEVEEVKSQNFGTTLYGKTASDFFTAGNEAKYLLKTETEHVGDRGLFNSELNRSNKSKVNWINMVLAPFLILCSGL